MKINEVESVVGITKKNIRFYESEGLLSPRRNSENGYREYGEEEVEMLKKIKIFRKLGFPLEEIRKMQNGTLTVADCALRHRVSLVREEQNVKHSIALCENLSKSEVKMEDMNADEVLAQISALESGGTTFQNKHQKDRKSNMYSAVAISTMFVLLIMAAAVVMIVATPKEWGISPLLWIVISAVAVAVILAVLRVLIMRLKEITDGEIEEAKRY